MKAMTHAKATAQTTRGWLRSPEPLASGIWRLRGSLKLLGQGWEDRGKRPQTHEGDDAREGNCPNNSRLAEESGALSVGHMAPSRFLEAPRPGARAREAPLGATSSPTRRGEPVRCQAGWSGGQRAIARVRCLLL